MEKVIIYCRKSEKPKNRKEKLEERQILSLESQEKELKAYAVSKGFKVVKIFKENESAYKKGRPLFNEMVSMIEAGKADCILVWHLTRIARNSYDGGRVIYLLDEGVLKQIITPKKRYQNTGEDKFILSIEFAMAKKSSDDNSSFVKRDIQSKADNGEFPGKARIGYLNINKEGLIAGRQFDSKKQIMLEELGRPLKRIEIDPVDGILMQQIFEEAEKGIRTLDELCEMSFKLGLRSNRSSKKLSKGTLKAMLQDPFYYGAFMWEGKLYTKNIKHEPLVLKELFDKVQEKLNKKSFRKKEKIDYQFSSLMICGECGSTVSSQLQKGRKYYHCTGYKAKKQNCKCSQRRYYEESVMEGKIFNLLKTLEIPQEFMDWGKDVIRDSFEEENQAYEKQRLANQNNLNVAKKKLSNLFQLKISPHNENGELLSDSEYLNEKQELQEEIFGLEEKLNDNNYNENDWLNKCESFFEFVSKLREEFENSKPERKRIILQSIGKIVLNNGELAFQLEEPYLYAAEVVKATNSFFDISEHQKGLTINDNPIFEPILNKWRNGRDSNPRPPA
jgi:site-specific DNA recombinase